MNEKLRNHLAILEKHEVPYSVIKLPKPAVRSSDVIDCTNFDAIVKTIMFKKKDGDVFAVAIPSKYLVCYKKIKRLVEDKKVSTLRPESMRELGWEPGECCPIGIPGPLYVDESVFDHELINTGSGDLMHGIEFPAEALRKLRDDIHVVDVKKER